MKHLWTLLPLALLSGCASAPQRGETITVAVNAVLRDPADLVGSERAALAASPVDPAAMAEGRLLRVNCAVMSDGSWGGLALLPPGDRAGPGQALRLTLQDPGDNSRDGVNRVTDTVRLPDPHSRRQAYTFVPDWRERGRSSNIDPVPLPEADRGRYLVVQGSYLIRCSG